MFLIAKTVQPSTILGQIHFITSYKIALVWDRSMEARLSYVDNVIKQTYFII